MDLLEVMDRFPTQEACMEHLEKIRWGDKPYCPHCVAQGSSDAQSEIGRIGCYNCHDCSATFKVTCGTVFHGRKVDIQKWFLAIALIVNAKKSLSSHQLSRDLELNQKSAWFLMPRIRAEIAKKGGALLQGIIEADETYIGGKPRKGNKKVDRESTKRGRGTEKTAVIGAVERGGKVVASEIGKNRQDNLQVARGLLRRYPIPPQQTRILTPREVAEKLTGQTILEFIRSIVNLKDSELITDEFHAYNAIGRDLAGPSGTAFRPPSRGKTPRSLLKRANQRYECLMAFPGYGSHHHYQTAYTPLYVAERCYKYNYRDIESVFDKCINESMKVLS